MCGTLPPMSETSSAFYAFPLLGTLGYPLSGDRKGAFAISPLIARTRFCFETEVAFVGGRT
jgi:hypothetical protein